MNRTYAYIGLGSNLGERAQFLQQAIDAIFSQIGHVSLMSSVYETPALGFEGPAFLNACCKIKTHLSAEDLLKELKRIETQMGREKVTTPGYASRVMDLDLLIYGEEHVNSKDLQVPHPRLHERIFVLQPLSEIAQGWIHPVLKSNVKDLLSVCEDSSEISLSNERLFWPQRKFEFTALNYLAIEGNIGSGKTSLSHLISEEFNGRLVLERFADNPFLPKFYKDPSRYAFTLEMSFLADRYQQVSDDLSQLNLFKDFVVSDYFVYKSIIFSKVTLPSEEFKLYRTLFYQMFGQLPKPELCIYLYQNTERLKAQIRQRGRSFEQNISAEYLEKIQSGYLEFFKNQGEFKSKIIDVTDRDFIANRSDYIWLLNQIESEFSL